MVGFGFDVHQMKLGGKFVLGGVEMESEYGIIAHSDGDVLLHALMDAILGSIAKGDIGEHFPDTDMAFKGVSSLKLLEHVMQILKDEKFRLVNLDITVVLEKPKIMKYKEQMKSNISEICNIPLNRINIKATTNETMGFIGRKEGLAVYCICMVSPID